MRLGGLAKRQSKVAVTWGWTPIAPALGPGPSAVAGQALQVPRDRSIQKLFSGRGACGALNAVSLAMPALPPWLSSPCLLATARLCPPSTSLASAQVPQWLSKSHDTCGGTPVVRLSPKLRVLYVLPHPPPRSQCQLVSPGFPR